MSIFLSDLYKRNDAFYILWLIVDLMLYLRISQRSVLAERLQRSWTDVQYLAHVLVVEPLTKSFVEVRKKDAHPYRCQLRKGGDGI